MALLRGKRALFFFGLFAALALATCVAGQTDLFDAQIDDLVNSAVSSVNKECGPNANILSDGVCYGFCSGSLSVTGSGCTCDGKPCVSWKAGEAPPSSVEAIKPFVALLCACLMAYISAL